MHKYGIEARRKRKKYVYPGKTSQVVPNLVCELDPQSLTEVVFSDIFEIKPTIRSGLMRAWSIVHLINMLKSTACLMFLRLPYFDV